MPDWLMDAVTPEVHIEEFFRQLLLAFALGCVVAVIYRLTQGRGNVPAQNFASTLVLLTILLAVVTHVIGGNVARAFSLVGALSIVRFRTLVADTRALAFVVFAVVMGMAVGAGQPQAALLGLAVTGVAAVLVRPRALAARERWALRVRVAAGVTPEAPLQEVFRKHLADHRLVATSTTRQGSALDLTYHIRLRPASSASTFAAELNIQAGLQNIELRAL